MSFVFKGLEYVKREVLVSHLEDSHGLSGNEASSNLDILNEVCLAQS